MQTDYDIVIVGAGIVGLVLACALVKESFEVALVEEKNVEQLSLQLDDFQLRVSAINLACVNIFKNLNLWDHILASNRVSPFEKMQVWDSLGRGKIFFDCTEIACSSLGFILENAVIVNALLVELKKYSNLTIFSNKKPLGIVTNENGIELKLVDISLTTKLIVGADGANSWIREYTKIACHSWPYCHESLVMSVHTEFPHQKTAWQCFLPDGPLALLPLFDDHICSIVWSSSPHEIRRLRNLEEASFNLEITNAFEGRLGKIKKISTDMALPLVMRHAKEYVKPRVALIGDAAHTIHPLAGQGVNLGILDAAELAENIIMARDNKQDWGDFICLRRFERRRKSSNWLMIIGMDFFKRLFQSKSLVAINLRSLGLNAVNKLDSCKNQLIYYATGLSDDLPKLARFRNKNSP